MIILFKLSVCTSFTVIPRTVNRVTSNSSILIVPSELRIFKLLSVDRANKHATTINGPWYKSCYNHNNMYCCVSRVICLYLYPKNHKFLTLQAYQNFLSVWPNFPPVWHTSLSISLFFFSVKIINFPARSFLICLFFYHRPDSLQDDRQNTKLFLPRTIVGECNFC